MNVSAFYQVAITVLLAFLSAAIALVGYFVKDIRATLAEDQRRQDKEISELRNDLNDFKAALPHQYTLREDFIRAVASLDHKMDGIIKELSNVIKELGKLSRNVASGGGGQE